VTVTDYREIVAALRDVPGVSEADVEPDGDGGMGLLRLGLKPGVDEVEVATTVGKLLRDRFGIGVDADRVRIVEDTTVATLPAPAVPVQRSAERPAISRMHLVSSGLEVTVTVTLSAAGRSAVGESRGSASQVGVQRAVANATLRAVEQLLDGVARFELDHLEVTHIGSERTVLAGVSMLSAQGSERLTGAAGVREDVRQAVIRATLDALNRRFETLLT
jgi:hypothetical protein